MRPLSPRLDLHNEEKLRLILHNLWQAQLTFESVYRKGSIAIVRFATLSSGICCTRERPSISGPRPSVHYLAYLSYTRLVPWQSHRRHRHRRYSGRRSSCCLVYEE
jgi:hypothetical protein